MPKPIDFTGFSRCLYINFLSANSAIEVSPTTTHTNEGENHLTITYFIIIISLF